MPTHKGYFKPKHPEKYKGNPTNIVYRSSWEFRHMMTLDHDRHVVKWSSEEIIIWYQNPVKGSPSRYFPDFYVEYDDGRKVLQEIKPAKETRLPVNNGKTKTKRYLRECFNFAINEQKWAAARHYCEKRGMQFQILTENELGLKAK